jgi:hypothetical protein
MNRRELEQAALKAADCCLEARNYIALTDVFLEMGKLSPEDYQRWRTGTVPYLERVISLNLGQITAVCKAVRSSTGRGGLKASWTAYMSWGNAARHPLRFTKSGLPALERLWATHYLRGRARMQPPDKPGTAARG